MDDLFTMRTYIQNGNDGEERKMPKNPVWLPSRLPVYALESQLFSGNKPDYPYVGSRSKLMR